VCFGFDVTLDRGAGAIAVAHPGGWCELVETRPATDWIAARLAELAAAHDGMVAVDRYGAAGTVADEVVAMAPERVLLMSSLDVANAAALTSDAITGHRLAAIDSPPLTDAVTGAATRPIGDAGGFVWARAASAAPVAPLVAVSNAFWGALRIPPPALRPQVTAG
jgi:hypothetical protein